MGANFQDVLRDVHDPDTHSLKTTGGGGVVNSIVTVANFPSGFGGNITLDAGSKTQIVGNQTLSDSKGFIGLTTTTLGASPAFIGITTVANIARTITGSLTIDSIRGNVTLDDGSLTGIVGNITLSDPKGFIGLVTIVGSLSAAAGNITLDDGSLTGLVAGVNSIGFATVQVAAGAAFIGIVTVANASFPVTQSGTWDEVGINDSGNSITIDGNVGVLGNVTLTDSKTFIGLTTTTLGASPAFVGIVTIANSNIRAIAGNITLSDAKTYIGLTTTTLGVGTQFIGLVTANAVNVGTNKALIHKNIAFAQASIATIAVPTNTFKITQLLLNSNATVRVNIKSGASYLTGNVTLGISLNPGGGWVESGSPDSPVYIGLAGAAGIVIEKFDFGGVLSQIGGKLIYFDE